MIEKPKRASKMSGLCSTDTATVGFFPVGEKYTKKFPLHGEQVKWQKYRSVYIEEGEYDQYRITWRSGTQTVVFVPAGTHPDVVGKPAIEKEECVCLERNWYILCGDEFDSLLEDPHASLLTHRVKFGGDGMYKTFAAKGQFGFVTTSSGWALMSPGMQELAKDDIAAAATIAEMDVPAAIRAARSEIDKSAKPTQDFWAIWREFKFDLKDAGIRVAKISGEFTASYEK